MAGVRYRVMDLPVLGVGAFCPTYSVPFNASSWGLCVRTGAPGTLPIAAPAPTRIWAPPISADPLTQGSNNSPDVRLPDIYVAYPTNMGPSMHFGMAARRQTPIPVPALSWINAAMNAMSGNKIGGRIVTSWPRAFQRWPTIGSLQKNK